MADANPEEQPTLDFTTANCKDHTHITAPFRPVIVTEHSLHQNTCWMQPLPPDILFDRDGLPLLHGVQILANNTPFSTQGRQRGTRSDLAVIFGR